MECFWCTDLDSYSVLQQSGRFQYICSNLFVIQECPFYFPIRLQSNPDWVVDICGGRITNGTNLILFPHHGRCNQLWLYDGTFIRSKADPKYVIDVHHCKIKSGTRLHVIDFFFISFHFFLFFLVFWSIATG
eukprot:UN27142